MHTSSLTSALHQVMTANGWCTFELSCSPGSSLVPAAEDMVKELQQQEGAEDDDDKEKQEERDDLDPALAPELVKNLQDSGFKLRVPWAKALWRQSNVESSIKIFKKVLKASFLPGLPGMTAISFQRAVQLSQNQMNLRLLFLVVTLVI